MSQALKAVYQEGSLVLKKALEQLPEGTGIKLFIQSLQVVASPN